MPAGLRTRALFLALLGAALLVCVPPPVFGQEPTLDQQIQASRQRLERIREERALLQSDLQSVRGQVRDVSAELINIERQLSASRSVLAELEFQAEATAERAEENTALLSATRDRLQRSGQALALRLREIYKLGPLHTVRVLLGAESFSDLLTRYRYLRMMAVSDRSLVDKIGELEESLTAQDQELRESLRELTRLRTRRSNEVSSLRTVEEDRQTTLQRFQTTERSTRSRLDVLAEDEARLSGLMADLERTRAANEAAGAVVPTMGFDDAGGLEWPIDGAVIYRFGVQTRPNGTTLRWNGVGLSARPGAPVQAVRQGTVVLAGPFEGYGPTVVVSHGGGFYTLYLYLEDIGVVQGRTIEAGQVVGTVGGQSTPEGPHIEFQIRAPSDEGVPTAQDPLGWLRPRGGQ